MPSEYVVYFNNRQFVLTSRLPELLTSNVYGLFWGHTTFQDLPKLIQFFQSRTEVPAIFAGAENTELLFEQLVSYFNHIEAAGGVVFNSSNEVLLIKRFGRWDLPKGKVEVGEPVADAAVREVQEETGLKQVELVKPIITTYHTYTVNGKPMLKSTYWYAMRCNVANELIPQVEEGIEQVKWVKRSDLYLYLSDSYPSLMAVIKALD